MDILKKKTLNEDMSAEKIAEIVDRNCKIANTFSNISILINILTLGVLILAHLDDLIYLLS